MRTCEIEKCSNKHYGKGLCRKHYRREEYKINREHILARQRQYYVANRERKLAYLQQYCTLHREERAQYEQQYYAANREGIKARSRRWHAANRERILAHKKEYNLAHRDHRRNRWSIRKYGITIAEKEARVEKQDRQCAICKTRTPGGPYGQWCTDHNHATGQLRSELCNRCNKAIGLMEDDPAILESAAEYLRYYERRRFCRDYSFRKQRLEE